MKKTIAGLFAIAILIAPSFSYAQTATPATTADIDALKMEIIKLILQEVQILQDKLAALQATQDSSSVQQNSIASDVQTIKANTTPTGNGTDNTKTAPSTPLAVQHAEVDENGILWLTTNKEIDVNSIVLHNGDAGSEAIAATPTLKYMQPGFQYRVDFNPSLGTVKPTNATLFATFTALDGSTGSASVSNPFF